MTSEARLELMLLGGFRAHLSDGAALVVPAGKAQALLAYLALPPGHAHPREHLATLLWGSLPATQSRGSLRTALSQVHKSLPRSAWPALVLAGSSVALDSSVVDVDVPRFERLVADGRPAALEEAAGLYRGDLLAGLQLAERPFAEWLASERDRLRDLALQALARLFTHQQRAGLDEAAVGTGTRLLALDPLQEPIHRAVMRMYGRLGQREAARRQYELCVDALRRQLGAEPEPATQRVYQEVLAAPPSLAIAERPSVASAGPLPGAARTNLPSPTSELIGRAAALAEVSALIASRRLVTLVGAGGIGKTRLGLEVARALLPDYADGAWVAELAPLSDPRLVPVTVAVALGLALPSGAESPERVALALGARRLLLVLDNCEHVIEAAARMADALLRAASQVRVLATSREPLRVPGEYVYRVLPLQVPAKGTENREDVLDAAAVKLFVVRAKAMDLGFTLDAHRASITSAVCRRLDGIPLAIELAAARTAVFGLEGLAGRLDDRFHLLTGGVRTALPRQQTLRATLDWSYDLLPATERTVLCRLAVFAGSFTLEAASAVAADRDLDALAVVDSITNLAEKSLVVVEAAGTARRYRLLETTRAYALEKLTGGGKLDGVARRHAEHYRDVFERAEAEWEARPAAEWLADYGRQIDNLRAALDWAFSPRGDAAIGVALTAAAVPIWMQLSLLEEWRRRVEHALASLPAGGDRDRQAHMRLLLALGPALLLTEGPCPEMSAAWPRALELAERLADESYQRRALWAGFLDRFTNGAYREALDVARRLAGPAAGPVPGGASSTHPGVGGLFAAALHTLGDQAGARPYLERAHEHHVSRPYRSNTIRILWDQVTVTRCFLARVQWLQGFPETALTMARSALDGAQAIEHPTSVFYALIQAACPVALLTGDLPAAEHFLQLLDDLARKHARDTWTAWHTCFRGVLLLHRGDRATGVPVLQGALAAYTPLFFHMHHGFFLGELAGALGREGQAADGLRIVDDALERAQQREELWCVPELLRTKGELLASRPAAAPAAEEHFSQALEMAHRQGALAWELRSATSLARLHAAQGAVGRGQDLLEPVYRRFTEGWQTPDLVAAGALLHPAAADSTSPRRSPSQRPGSPATTRRRRACRDTSPGSPGA